MDPTRKRFVIGLVGVIVCPIICVTALIFMLVGSLVNQSRIPNSMQTDGTITSIELVTHQGADGKETDRIIYVNYNVDGVYYEDVKYPYSSFSMHEGDTVVVEYDPQDPTQIQSPITAKIGKYFLIGGGVVLVLSSAGLLASSILLSKNKRSRLT